MKRLSIPAIALLLSCMFIGCANQPDACFLIESNLVDRNQEIFFDNCSFNGNSYSWDFGDGNTSEIFEPSHSFPALGEYLVVLTVGGDKAGQQDDTFSEVIKVGNRILSQVEFTELPALNNGNPWDADSTAAADLMIRFKADGAADWNYVSPEFTDHPVPSIIDLSVSNMEFTPGLWTVELVDVDDVNEELMGTWMVDTDTITPGLNYFQIQDTETDFLVRYILQ